MYLITFTCIQESSPIHTGEGGRITREKNLSFTITVVRGYEQLHPPSKCASAPTSEHHRLLAPSAVWNLHVAGRGAPAHRPRPRPAVVCYPSVRATLLEENIVARGHAAWPAVTTAEHARHLSVLSARVPVPVPAPSSLCLPAASVADIGRRSCRRHAAHRWVSFGSWNLVHRWFTVA